MADIIGGQSGVVYFTGTLEECNEKMQEVTWPEPLVWIRLEILASEHEEEQA